MCLTSEVLLPSRTAVLWFGSVLVPDPLSASCTPPSLARPSQTAPPARCHAVKDDAQRSTFWHGGSYPYHLDPMANRQRWKAKTGMVRIGVQCIIIRADTLNH